MNNNYTHQMHLVKKKERKKNVQLTEHPSVVNGIGVQSSSFAFYFALIANFDYFFMCGSQRE